MATAWLSYAWTDNQVGDVDFSAQELIGAGLQIRLDRWNIQAGRRLWDQIERFIQDPSVSDGWILYATQHSLGSEPCREEFAYALDRALSTRGSTFPIIGLFPGPIDSTLIPAGIRTRLFVSLTDPDWKERIVAACEGREVSVRRPPIQPFQVTIHSPCPNSGGKMAIEVRPRAGTWAPFFAAIPYAEKHKVELSLAYGPRGAVPVGCTLYITGGAPTDDGKWWIEFAQNECTPTQSYFILCRTLPSQLAFGVNGGSPQFLVKREGGNLV